MRPIGITERTIKHNAYLGIIPPFKKAIKEYPNREIKNKDFIIFPKLL